MLDNEPEGGDRTGSEPAGDTAAETSAPVKRTRSRRKAVAEPPVEAPVEVADAAAETPAPTRRRRKAVEPAAAPEEGAPVKATRSRRKKAVAPEAVTPEPDVAPEADIVEPAPLVVDEAEAASPPRKAAMSAATVLFMAPQPDEVPKPATRPQAAEPVTADETVEPDQPTKRRRRGRRTAEPVETAAEAPVEVAATEVEEPESETDTADDDEDDDDAAARRRRRRGRRGRGRGKGSADDELDEDETAEAESVDADGDEGDSETVTRRRRRRRRKGDDGESSDDDGVVTVVKIREPRRTSDEVQGVSGSTRLEAKRQRRRDGREQRRTRPPILTESEFLARREAVDRVMVIRQKGDRTQIGVLEDGVLVEHYVTRASAGTMAGNVYLGKVQNVLPSMEAAFVDVGRGRNAVLYAGEVNWDATGLEGRARSIEQALKSGDSVLVQVTKDPIGHKGARLTSHIALSGRHLVYVPNGNASGISRKLPDNERKRLRDVLKKLVPDGAGVIVRTAAEGATEDELARDVKRLQAQWEDIQARAAEGGAPALLYEEPELVVRVVRDLFNEDFRELVIQGDEAFDMVESYLAHVSPDLVSRLRRHAGAVDVFAEKRIDEQILKGLDRKVFLPSGGHLVIDRTEAMTVVDVNTGKYTGAGGNLEETVTRNNLEAAEEIVRQLRLRDLGGIVVIDFIDMVLESNRELVLRRLTECLGRDRTKHQVTEITSLGLVQMTRKRIGAGLLEAFSETCEHCKGRGLVIHTEPVPARGGAGAPSPAGDKVKAVAAAAPPASTAPPTSTSSRRRGRKSAAAPAAPEVAAAASPVVADVVSESGVVAPSAAAAPVAEIPADDLDDTMGYDLSRYESVTPVSPAGPVADDLAGDLTDAEPMRLAGADDPDAVDGGEPTARRRSRRRR
ncbi:Rne/Rng family ribonuclease [Actinomycetes bacterium KLBMP 9797]